MFGARFLLLLLLALGRTEAANAQIACQGKQKTMAVAEMMFGRKIGDRIGVSNSAWARFVDSEITPRFPDGLTVVDAAGQWRDPEKKRVVREPSKLVTIVLADALPDLAKLEAIAEVYKSCFRQQAVMIVVRPACVSF